MSRCVPISHGSAPDRAPVLAGVSTASDESRTAQLRCYKVAYKNEISVELITELPFAKKNYSNIPRQKRTPIRVGDG